MENPIYRIKVEVIGPEKQHIDEAFLKGVECNGFVMIASQEDGVDIGIQTMTTLDIKTMHVCVCDVCGFTVQAKEESDFRNDVMYTKPDGWTCGVKESVHICEECGRKLAFADNAKAVRRHEK